MENPEKIKCPILTVWIIFALNIYFIDTHIFFYYNGIDNKDKDNKYNDIIYKIIPRFFPLFFTLFLVILLIGLIGSIFITISFEKNKYSFYLVGLIMTSIFSLLMSIMLILFGNGYIVLKIFQISIEWSQLFVLLIYNKRVKSSFKYSHLNDNMISDFPKEAQPLRQHTKQEGEQDIYI